MQKQFLQKIITLLVVTWCLVATLHAQTRIGAPGAPTSTLDVKGSFAATYNNITATTYTMTTTDYYLAWNGAANGTITLPAATIAAPTQGNIQGRVYQIKNTSTSSNLTVAGNGAELLDNQSGAGVSSISLPAGYYAMLISKGTTTGTTWEVAFIGNSNAACVPGYALAAFDPTTVLPGIPQGTDILFNTIKASNNVTYTPATGSFALLAGNTYQLDASVYLANFSVAQGLARYVWVDATNTPLTTATYSQNLSTNYNSGNDAQNTNSVAIYTPTVNTNVKVRLVLLNGGTCQPTVGYAMVKQLNPCGGSGAASGATAAQPDYDWLRQSDSQVPTNPTDIAVPIKHGGAANQDISVFSSLSEAGLGNYAQYSLALGNTANPITANFFVNNTGVTGRTIGLQSQSADPITFRTTTSNAIQPFERMRITSAGYVGIGTQTPLGALHTINSGTVNYMDAFGGIPSQLRLRSAGGSFGAPTAVTAGTQLGAIVFQGYNGTGFSSAYSTICSNATETHTTTANGSDMKIETTANGTTLPLVRVYASQNGNVGINTITPRTYLEVSGNIFCSNGAAPNTSNGNLTAWNSIRGGFGESEFVNYYGLGSGGFRLYSLAAGTPTAANQIGFFNTAGAYTQLSDARVKTDIKSVANGLNTVMALHPVTYDMHQGRTINNGVVSFTKDDKTSKQIGFTAQELVKVVPEAVEAPKDDKKELYTVNYTMLIPILTKAIQEQQAQIQQQQVQIEALKAQNATKDAQIAALQAQATASVSRTEYNELKAMVTQLLAQKSAAATTATTDEKK